MTVKSMRNAAPDTLAAAVYGFQHTAFATLLVAHDWLAPASVVLGNCTKPSTPGEEGGEGDRWFLSDCRMGLDWIKVGAGDWVGKLSVRCRLSGIGSLVGEPTGKLGGSRHAYGTKGTDAPSLL